MVCTSTVFIPCRNDLPGIKVQAPLAPQNTIYIACYDTIISLPEGKTAIDVFADFLRYLYQYAQKYIEETHFHGIHLWENLRPTSEFVLTHPNGWEGRRPTGYDASDGCQGGFDS